MLLTRTEEVRIILEKLTAKEKRLVNTLATMKTWEIRTRIIDLNHYQPYIETEKELVDLREQIETYKKLVE